ncbi:Alpha/beta hydrolase fold-3 [Macrophomina phaseolina MS6]|uniref:Alpha/beta hydrolase fold-3 n=1 Tax=Macrophomina phaseolina (strain MS6) TaxID=1126212 RepID=K2QMK4_MACPH|nr:Alpha/beta hydrolase fold-3 [Macrophomina phaseolina MS6]
MKNLVPLVVYMHDGGVVAGGPKTDDISFRAVALHCGVVVLNVEYRLAPENKSPVECQRSYGVVNRSRLSVDLDEGFILGATSAGANFATRPSRFFASHADEAESRQKLSLPLKDLLFFAPSVCHSDARPDQYKDCILSVDEVNDAPRLTRKSIGYLAGKCGAPPTDRRVSPLRFPPNTVFTTKSLIQVWLGSAS